MIVCGNKFFNSTTYNTVVLLFHKKAYIQINLSVEFCEGYGKIPLYDAPNVVEKLKQQRKRLTPKMVEAIKDALKYFQII